MVTKGDKIAFTLIALLFILAIIFRKDLRTAFDGRERDEERKEKKNKKDKDKKGDKKVSSLIPIREEDKLGRTVLYA